VCIFFCKFFIFVGISRVISCEDPPVREMTTAVS